MVYGMAVSENLNYSISFGDTELGPKPVIFVLGENQEIKYFRIADKRTDAYLARNYKQRRPAKLGRLETIDVGSAEAKIYSATVIATTDTTEALAAMPAPPKDGPKNETSDKPVPSALVASNESKAVELDIVEEPHFELDGSQGFESLEEDPLLFMRSALDSLKVRLNHSDEDLNRTQPYLDSTIDSTKSVLTLASYIQQDLLESQLIIRQSEVHADESNHNISELNRLLSGKDDPTFFQTDLLNYQ
jgi:hypothetical protein